MTEIWDKYKTHIIGGVVIIIIAFLLYQINSPPTADETDDYENYDDYGKFAQWHYDKWLTPPPPRIIINLKNVQFNPDFIIVPVNTVVNWINLDSKTHRIVESSQKVFDSGNLKRNHSFLYRFTREGTYYYQSQDHPQMRGTIMVVRER